MHTPPLRPNPELLSPITEQTARIDSSQLLRGGRTVEIDHAGQRYTLRLTRENKLILTK